MAMTMDVKAKVDQLSPTILSEGDTDYPRMSNIGQIFTANWQERLILAGKAYRVSIGTIATGNAHVFVGTGTEMDLDKPTVIVAADNGYIIPMELNWAGYSIAVADNDEVEVLVAADRTTAVAAGATATVETPDNLLDGAPAFGGRAWSITSSVIADPVFDDIIYYKVWETLGTNPLGPVNHYAHKTWSYPTFLAGPCSLLLYTFGTKQTTGMGALVFAHIPASWVPTS